MEKLKQYLDKRGLTQKEFSKRSGVSESMLTRIMQGRTPKLDALMKIRKATNGQVRPEHWT